MCHVVGGVENSVLLVQLVAKENSCPLCCQVVMTHVLVHLRQIGENVASTVINIIYDAEVRAKIAKHASEYGNKSASVKFTQESGHCVSESSVRNMKAYFQKLKSLPDPAPLLAVRYWLGVNYRCPILRSTYKLQV